MKRARPSAGVRQERDLRALDGPPYDEHTLVFAIAEPGCCGPAVARLRSGDPVGPGLESVLHYVEQGRAARLRPLAEESRAATHRGVNWELRETSSQGRLSGTHHLRLDSPADRGRLENELRRDPRIRHVHQPAIHYPLSTGFYPDSMLHAQWGLRKCGFDRVWAFFEQGEDPGPAGIIDDGGPTQHPDLDGCITKWVPPESDVVGRASHAARVAAILAARRDECGERGMAGCCQAKLHVYDAWPNGLFDSAAYYEALRDVARSRLPVLNVSLGSAVRDPTADALVARCVECGVVVVAAMGNFADRGSPATYPAAHPNAIAVSATGRFDRRWEFSSIGPHNWIAAPGEDILTVFDGDSYRGQNGTSFAAPMVAAAAWLVRRVRPAATPAEVRAVLAAAVAPASAPAGGRSDQLGHGRLDMVRLVELLQATASA